MVFLSYSWHDAEVAHRLGRALHRAGLAIWIDVRHLDTQGNIEAQLRDAIRSSQLLLHLDTGSSRKSPWVAFEREAAVQSRKIVVDLQPSPFDQMVQAVHFGLNHQAFRDCHVWNAGAIQVPANPLFSGKS